MYPSSASATIGIVQKCVRFLACVLMFLLLLQRRNRYERVCRSSEVMVLAQRVANKEGLKLSQDELRQVAESAGGDLRQLLNQLQLIQLQRGIDSSSLTPSNSSTDTSNNQSVFIPHYPNTKEDLSFPRGKRRPSRSLSFLRDANAPHRRLSSLPALLSSVQRLRTGAAAAPAELFGAAEGRGRHGGGGEGGGRDRGHGVGARGDGGAERRGRWGITVRTGRFCRLSPGWRCGWETERGEATCTRGSRRRRGGRVRGRVLGKSSTLRKNGRLMGEVQAHMCLSTTGGKKAVAMDYFGMLNMYLLRPLMNGDVGKIVN